MLVLTRKLNESILIGDDIEIMIVEVKGEQVKIGISAPKSMRVYRGELYREIQQQNLEAAETATLPDNLDILLSKKNKS